MATAPIGPSRVPAGLDGTCSPLERSLGHHPWQGAVLQAPCCRRRAARVTPPLEWECNGKTASAIPLGTHRYASNIAKAVANSMGEAPWSPALPWLAASHAHAHAAAHTPHQKPTRLLRAPPPGHERRDLSACMPRGGRGGALVSVTALSKAAGPWCDLAVF